MCPVPVALLLLVGAIMPLPPSFAEAELALWVPVLNGEPSAHDRGYAAERLDALGAEGLPGRDAESRLAALDGIRQAVVTYPELVADREMIAAVERAVGDANPEVAVAACLAVGEFGGAPVTAVGRLVELLGRGTPGDELSRSVVCALGQFGPAARLATPLLVTELKRAISRQLPTARWTMIELIGSLERIGDLDATAAEVLVPLLDHSDVFVASSAAEALAGVRHPGDGVIAALQRALMHTDDGMRIGAASSLFALTRDGAAVDVLGSLLAHQDDDIRMRALVSLERCSGAARRFLVQIEALAADPAFRYREVAAHTSGTVRRGG